MDKDASTCSMATCSIRVGISPGEQQALAAGTTTSSEE
jgi:hypothetical protein